MGSGARLARRCRNGKHGAQLHPIVGWLKVVFAVAVAVDAPLIGWLAQGYGTAGRIITIVGVVGVVALSILVVSVNRRAYQLLRELENA